VPLSGYGCRKTLSLAGATKRADVAPLFTQVSPDFFNTMGIRIMTGRAFSERDTANSLKVAIVNQSSVKKILTAPIPLARTFKLRRRWAARGRIYEVVGLVRDNEVLRLAR